MVMNNYLSKICNFCFIYANNFLQINTQKDFGDTVLVSYLKFIAFPGIVIRWMFNIICPKGKQTGNNIVGKKIYILRFFHPPLYTSIRIIIFCMITFPFQTI